MEFFIHFICCVLKGVGRKKLLIIFSLTALFLDAFHHSYWSGFIFLLFYQFIPTRMLCNLVNLVCFEEMLVIVYKWFGWFVSKSFERGEIRGFFPTIFCLLSIWFIGLSCIPDFCWWLKAQKPTFFFYLNSWWSNSLFCFSYFPPWCCFVGSLFYLFGCILFDFFYPISLGHTLCFNSLSLLVTLFLLTS